MMKFLPWLLFLVLPLRMVAQGDVRTEALKMSAISVQFGFHMPLADMADRYGNSFVVGGGYDLKTKKNWIFGLDAGAILGNEVVNGDQVFIGAQTSEGGVIGQTGELAEVLVEQRGTMVNFRVGKLLPILAHNPNSGLVVKAGVGFLEHRIWIESRNDDVIFLEGPAKQGYDRLTSGLSLNQFLGYQHAGSKNSVNFFMGIECIQGFTKVQRSYSIDFMRTETERRLDMLWGLRAGWMFLIYKRKPQEYYFQ